MIVASDITVCGTEMESLYRQARQEGVLFFRSPSPGADGKERQGDGETGRRGDVPLSKTAQSPKSASIDSYPQVSIEKGVITVRVYDPALAKVSTAATANNGGNGDGCGDDGPGRPVTISLTFWFSRMKSFRVREPKACTLP